MVSADMGQSTPQNLPDRGFPNEDTEEGYLTHGVDNRYYIDVV